ncbi:CinA family protein [Terricaulis sp.]|uniref:CinA family protein n=1 Tax=Terricaulis sp. TaxID=2768686 RepID=UPI002AC4FC8F|nr:CinA family protein [Terricaulis sp.]MDZ4692684.1 CinA family protein [Terricaulis sp.]
MDNRPRAMSYRQMIADRLVQEAQALFEQAKKRRFRIVTAESCTGGLIAASLTAVPGSSLVVERGFVTYSNEAKVEMLGVPADLIERRGAVSMEVALAMVDGALKHSPADIAIVTTGIAGPGGGSDEKPVGLVHIAVARRNGPRLHEEHRFGDIGRNRVQADSVVAALQLAGRILD